MSVNNAISLIGIIFDILGAWFLAMGLIKKPIEEIRIESVMNFFNYSYALGYIKQKTESTVGFLYLFIGFFMQGFSYIDTQITNWGVFYIILPVAIILGFSIYVLSAKYLLYKNKEFILRVIKAEFTDHNKIPIDPYQINKYLSLLDKKYEDQINLYFTKHPNYDNLIDDEKRIAKEEWLELHKALWEKLKDKLNYKE